MSHFIITADTTFDLAPETVERLQIVPIVSYVSLGDEMMDDYPGIPAEDLFAYVAKTGKLPQTAAANPGDYEAAFRKLRETDDRPIIHIAKSSGISSCYENAVIAAREVENVYVVDSKNVSGGSALTIVRAAESTLEDPEELVADLEAYTKRIDCSFIIETLDFLYKGGRCSGLAAFGANLLKLRPEIIMDDGKMSPGKKYRGPYEKCVLSFLDEKLENIEQFEPEQVYINHTLQDPAMLDRVLGHIKAKNYFKNFVVYSVCAAVATHCGPNTFGIITVRK
ncbi:MAG: DegV family protein [Lachnospiraceae bacterium]|nr:DegV family protein [Lachnospiraceae bacterium]